MVFWRDVREIGVGVALVIFFLVFGMKYNAWPDIFLSGCILFVCLFLFMDRFGCRKNRLPDGTLKECAENSLAEVNHQIWLLRNVFWWYLLPPLVGFVVQGLWMEFFLMRGVQEVLEGPKTILSSVLDFLISLWLPAVLFIGVYWLNQWAVKAELLPRKREVEDLLQSINNGNEEIPPVKTKKIGSIVFLSLLISLVFSVSLICISQTGWMKNWMGNAGQQTVVEITPPLSSEEAAGPKELKILSARYGVKDHWFDVTQIVIHAVHENTLSIHCGNDLTGRDPSYGHTKILEIECLWDGQKRTIRVREGMDLMIPFKSDPNSVGTGQTGITDFRL
jgi:hypothetical protein